MFAIFSLRRPNILPVGVYYSSFIQSCPHLHRRASTGDIGVQRGLLRFVLSLHSPAHPFRILKKPDAGLAPEDPILPPPRSDSSDQKLPIGGGFAKAPPLPTGLNVNVLKSRLDGKKVKCVHSVTRHCTGGNLKARVAGERS
jgi:hypothetical protein